MTDTTHTMSSNESKPRPGPELLNERTLSGIFVHFLGFFTVVVGPGLIYLISDHDFTRANARNVLNWYLTVLVLTLVAIGVFLLGADTMTVAGNTMEWSPLPGPLGSAFGVVGAVLLLLTMLSWMATFFFVLFATFKAITGTAWEYPFARDLIGSERG